MLQWNAIRSYFNGDSFTGMHRLFEEGMCRIHLRALQEWSNVSTNQADIQPPAPYVPDEKPPCVHLVAKLLGSGSRFMLHLLLQNISDTIIENLTVFLQVTNGNLLLEHSSAKLSLILPTSQNWLKINARDPTNQGGTISVIVIKGVELDRGLVVCATKINISPNI